MFQTVLTGNPRLMNLGARDHALINATMSEAVAPALKMGDWTCHVCQVRLKGLMEVDHLKGHRSCGASDLRPICQFCHDLKHPMWAMARKRAFPIYAPDLDQSSLSRLSWSLLCEMTRPDGTESFDPLVGSFGERESAAYDLLQGENMESALEAIIVVRDREGAALAQTAAALLDASIRYLPTVIRDGEPVQKWTVSGFREVPLDLLHTAMGPVPDLSRMSAASRELQSI